MHAILKSQDGNSTHNHKCVAHPHGTHGAYRQNTHDNYATPLQVVLYWQEPHPQGQSLDQELLLPATPTGS